MTRDNCAPFYVSILIALASLTASAGCTVRLSAGQSSRPPAPPDAGSRADAQALTDAAYEQIKQDHHETALEMCRKAVALDPTLAEAHKNMAIALCDQGRCEEALAPAAEAVKLKPGFDKARYVLGKVLSGVGRYRDAVAEYKEALRINGEYDKAYFGLGVTYDRLNDPAAAAEAFGQAVRLKPQEWEYRLKLVLASRHVGRAGRPASLRLPTAAELRADEKAARTYQSQVRDCLYHGEYGLLEQAAAQARSSKARVPGGYWELGLFYGGLSAPGAGDSAPEAEWQYHFGKLKEWSALSRESLTARVALADTYIKYAWRARGKGLANTVTEKSWEVFRERLAAAASALEEARGLGAGCPQWYAVMLNLGLGQGWDAEAFERHFEEATAFEPDYPPYYVTKAVYLQPRWHGRPGDWVRFAESAADRKGGKVGGALYYMIIDGVGRSSTGESRHDDFLAGEGVSWPRVKQGIVEVDQLYGMNTYETNRACLLATTMGDQGLSRELFKRIGDKWEPSVWGSRQFFDLRKGWALGQR